MPHLSCKGFHYETLQQQLIQILDNTQALFNSILPYYFVLLHNVLLRNIGVSLDKYTEEC